MTDPYPALKAAADYCREHHIAIPEDLAAMLADIGMGGIKALQDYDNRLTRLVSIYLNQLMTRPGLAGADFGVDFANAIEMGLNEAWWLGMRENDVTEMLPEWQDELDGIIAEERTHIADFAAYLTEVAGMADTMGEAITTAQARLSLWINRYNEVYNLAILRSADEKTKMEWVYGDTEHCDTCAQLNGMVAYAREWDECGIKPQNPPNDVLSCGGWKCQCQLVPTDKRRSPDALTRLLDIATSANA